MTISTSTSTTPAVFPTPRTYADVIAVIPPAKGTASGDGFTVSRTKNDPNKVAVLFDAYRTPKMLPLFLSEPVRKSIGALAMRNVKPDTDTERAFLKECIDAYPAEAVHDIIVGMTKPSGCNVALVTDSDKAQAKETKRVLEAQPAHGITESPALKAFDTANAEALKAEAHAELVAYFKAKGFPAVAAEAKAKAAEAAEA